MAEYTTPEITPEFKAGLHYFILDEIVDEIVDRECVAKKYMGKFIHEDDVTDEQRKMILADITAKSSDNYELSNVKYIRYETEKFKYYIYEHPDTEERK